MRSTKDLTINGMPFINDAEVIGKWEYYDVINSYEDFNVSKPKTTVRTRGYKEIYFYPKGKNTGFSKAGQKESYLPMPEGIILSLKTNTF